ncbi:hypothetical protein BJX70DRAFT_400819 [Aspergillus crustosus]
MSLPLLPQELLFEIVSDLEDGEVARLMVANCELASRLEPVLYARDGARNRAMFWACRTGQTRLIRRLVLKYDTPVSAVIFYPKPPSSDFPDPGLILTLHIAAARGHIDAFCLLLELGARVDLDGLATGVHRKFIQRICSPSGDWELLRLYFEAGLNAQLRLGHHPSFALPLFWVILNSRTQSKPPLAQVEMLLSRGAERVINEPYKPYPKCFVTPFTLAMCQRSYDPIPLIDLLLRGGALINGPKLHEPVRRPTHIPVFVAVEHMASTGDTTLLDWCLEHGANINHRTAAVYTPTAERKYMADDRTYYYCTTSPLVYVHAIKSWDDSNKSESENEDEVMHVHEQKRLVSPLQGLFYLLDRGANIDPVSDDHGEEPTARIGRTYVNIGAPWLLEHLLQKWGLDLVEQSPDYRTLVNYLLRRSIERGYIAEMLVRCEFALRIGYTSHPYYHRQFKPQSEKVVRLWTDIIRDLIMPECPLTPTRLLAEYIVSKGRRLDALQETGKATIDLLLAAQADINVRMDEDGSTPLHQLCREYNVLERGDGSVWFQRQRTVKRDRQEFLRYLFRKGADPRLRTVQGSTPRDLFLVDIRCLEYGVDVSVHICYREVET